MMLTQEFVYRKNKWYIFTRQIIYWQQSDLVTARKMSTYKAWIGQTQIYCGVLCVVMCSGDSLNIYICVSLQMYFFTIFTSRNFSTGNANFNAIKIAYNERYSEVFF